MWIAVALGLSLLFLFLFSSCSIASGRLVSIAHSRISTILLVFLFLDLE